MVRQPLDSRPSQRDQRRFGADIVGALSKLIEGVENPDRLAEVGDLVVDCATGSELLARADRA